MKKEVCAKFKGFLLICAATICAATFIGKAQAATYGANVTVSPMPFSGGASVKIKADCFGPFSNVTEYVSVSDDTHVIFDRRIPRNVKVDRGQSVPFTVDWTVPSNLRAEHLSVFVVFLEGNETYVGEPGPDRSLKLVARCPARTSKAEPCKYATAKYWIITTKQK